MKQLENRIAIVTGGAQGIGPVTGARLAAEGAKIVLADVAPCEKAVEAIRGTGGQATSVRVDVTDAAQVAEMVEHCRRTFGAPDILINNAALASALDFKPIEAISSEEWARVFDVNVRGVFECTKAVAPAMREGGYGTIVNMGSGTFLKGMAGLPHYVASKGAVVGMTRAFARELGSDGIRVNCVSPGLVMTEEMREHATMGSEAVASAQIGSRAIPREQVPEDLAGAIVFLCTGNSDFITGQTLVVDGGSFFH
ncbi:Short-chain dehydrogenase/reductase SDR [Pseudooceanicola batsensis HTCC2597]|uniref:Short-chain dehydrogenase/reductase SDR n=1 Tax=Pseudooceanicola batsensis (strain ATCC BAA-863 / DSM 15984 / KCTC 12145 / HTCC2597) TaxID=252305 RepID=A3U137_PSEBH|nr:glucose 1-dehydrogenase [Pseudooceanicola batsensis]EAQ02020.1 Short-chain dehydrogenase/reductase SDR [Pseudooceanicola batsensis HTCC2597]